MTTVLKFDVKRCKVYRKQTLLKTTDVETLLCSACSELLRDPVQVTACGDRFCRGCIEKLMSSSEGPYRCPVDDEEFVCSEVRTDRGCLKELQSLEIECTTQPTPCNWRGPLTKLEIHLSECPNAEMDCPLGCGGCLLKSQLSSHVSSQCPNRPVECQYCKTSVPQSHLERHFALCEESEHCSLNSPAIKEVKRPLLNDSVQHDNTQAEIVVGSLERKRQTSKIRSEITGDVSKRVEEIKQSVDANSRQILKMDESLQNMEKTQQQMMRCMHTLLGTQVQCRPDALDTDTPESMVSQMRQDLESQQTQLLKISDNLQTVQQSLTQHAVVIDEVRLRQDVLDVKTTNGVFIWKIPDIRRRYRDALDGRTISLYSPPFLTSPHGYRMCVRTYLNGDGIGKGTHMSIFFVLMRSEHDRLLSYPFEQSVQFTLINQAEPRASITDTFILNLSSPSFQKPQTDMNVACGFPKFAHHSVFCDKAFTRGDVIFIKCQVEKEVHVGREYSRQNAFFCF